MTSTFFLQAFLPFLDGWVYVAGASEVNAEGHGLSRVLVSILGVLSAVSGEAAARAFKYIVHWHCFDILDNLDDDTETFVRFLRQLDDHEDFTYHLAPSTLVVMVQSAATILHSNIERVDNDDAVHAIPTPLRELLDFVLAGVPITERLFPEYDFTENHIPGAVPPDKLFAKLFTTPCFVPEFFESMLQNSDFVSSSTCENLLLTSLDKLYLPGRSAVFAWWEAGLAHMFSQRLVRCKFCQHVRTTSVPSTPATHLASQCSQFCVSAS